VKISRQLCGPADGNIESRPAGGRRGAKPTDELCSTAVKRVFVTVTANEVISELCVCVCMRARLLFTCPGVEN
jgi:hypothetical protein